MKLNKDLIGKVVIREGAKKETRLINNEETEVLNYDLVTTPLVLLNIDKSHIILIQPDGNRIILDDRMDDDMWMLYEELDPLLASNLEKDFNASVAYQNSVSLDEDNEVVSSDDVEVIE